MGPVEAVYSRGPEVNPVERLAALLGDDMRAAEALIHDRMLSEVALVPKLATHLVDSGGKRLRPLITLAAARHCGYAGAAHHKLAAAVEFIHTATLLHDDVVDESALRRGRPAANMLWGNKPSVLVGDFLFARAFQLMVETGSLTVLDILANASAIIAEGEVMQLRVRQEPGDDGKGLSRGDLGQDRGAVRGRRGSPARSLPMPTRRHDKLCATMGNNLGIAFQLVDDALDYSGRQAVMGKSVGDDFRECKVTLPIILTIARADNAERRFWRKTIEVAAQEEGDLARAIEYLERGSALAQTMERARAFAAAARDNLAPLPASDIRNALADIADFVVERAY